MSQQFAHPGATEALKILAEEVPLSLWRHAVRLPDGGAVVTMTDPAGGQFIRFDRNWRMDRTFTNRFELRFPSDLNLAMDTRGGLLVSGNFLSLNGRPFTGIARLLPTGAIDPNFSARILDTTAIPARVSVADLAVQPDGRVLIGGLFTQINGMECTYLARLNSDGSLDRQFSSRFSQARYQQALRRLRTPRIASRSDAALVQASAARGNIATAPAAIPSIAEAPREASPPADSETIVIQSLELNTNGVAIQFLGAANHTYILQVRESWDAGEWVSVVSSQTDATGAGVFQDEGAAWKPIAFYRILRMP